MANWYLATTKLKSELKVKQNLWAKHQIETFFPAYPPKKAESASGLPLFPRYIFIYCDLEKHFKEVQYTPGLGRLVTFGTEFPPVPGDVIDYLKSRCDEQDQILPTGFVEGQLVRVREGVFEGCEGIIREKRGNKRVQLLLQLAYGEYMVEMSTDQIEHSTKRPF